MATKPKLTAILTPLAGAVGQTLPAKPVTITRNLLTLDGCARETVKIYRQARRGELPTAEATRLTFILKSLADMLELVQIERRLLELEENIKNGGSR